MNYDAQRDAQYYYHGYFGFGVGFTNPGCLG